jgi:hypothetical protein
MPAGQTSICAIKDENYGYLTIFREHCNQDSTGTVKLPLLAGKPISITDLVSNTSHKATVTANGEVDFEIADAPGFLFYRYSS